MKSQRDLEAVRRLLALLLRESPVSIAPGELPSDLVREHHLGPLAFRAGCSAFREDYAAASVLARIRERQLGEVVRALGAAGVEVALLKGVSYVGWLYDDPAERPMGDVDLLTRQTGHDRALAVLEGLGYRVVSAPVSRAPWYHAVTLRRAETLMDLHRNIVAPWRSRIDLAGVWARARTAPERNDGVLRLDPTDEALFHLAHISRHELAVPAIAWVDAARLLGRLGAPGRAALEDRARRFRLRRSVEIALGMLDLLREGDPNRTWSRSIDRAVLPSPTELMRGDAPPRPIQLLRKAYLLDGPAQLAGLAALWLAQRLPTRKK